MSTWLVDAQHEDGIWSRQLVDADDALIRGGALVFTDADGVITHAYAPTAWRLALEQQ